MGWYIFLFIYSNCILHPYGSSNYNTKVCKRIKEKQHKHNKYVNVGEIYISPRNRSIIFKKKKFRFTILSIGDIFQWDDIFLTLQNWSQYFILFIIIFFFYIALRFCEG